MCNKQGPLYIKVYVFKATSLPPAHHVHDSPLLSHISCQMNPFQSNTQVNNKWQQAFPILQEEKASFGQLQGLQDVLIQCDKMPVSTG